MGLPTGAFKRPLPGVPFCFLGFGFFRAFASEKSLSSMWGIVLKEGASEEGDERMRRSRLGLRCRSIAAAHDLTEREEETLFQLLQGKRPARIADELGVELSTVRTHIKHVYQKLDVHSSKELMERAGVLR